MKRPHSPLSGMRDHLVLASTETSLAPVEQMGDLFLSLCFWIAGSIHEPFVVRSHLADERMYRMVRAMRRERTMPHSSFDVDGTLQPTLQQFYNKNGQRRSAVLFVRTLCSCEQISSQPCILKHITLRFNVEHTQIHGMPSSQLS